MAGCSDHNFYNHDCVYVFFFFFFFYVVGIFHRSTIYNDLVEFSVRSVVPNWQFWKIRKNNSRKNTFLDKFDAKWASPETHFNYIKRPK